MPTPIDLKPGTHLHLDFDAQRIAKRAPVLMAGVGAAIASWSWVEQHYENIRAILELTDFDLSLSEFKTYRLSSRQREKLLAAAKKRLSPTLLPLFLDAFELATGPAGQRNEIAHGLIAFWDARPDVLVIYQPAHFQEFFRKTSAPTIFTGRVVPTDVELDVALKEMAHTGTLFDSTDFAHLVAQSSISNEILISLANMCSSDPNIAGLGERMVRANPHVIAYVKAKAKRTSIDDTK